jgi:dihydropteroate synthase
MVPCRLMGILNVTPDSFSDGGQYAGVTAAVDRGLEMIAEGADLIDVGGESTRPGADHVPLEEEIRRTIPVVHGLTQRGIAVSIDTSKAEVARLALEAGATMINDVTGLSDPRMEYLAAEHKCDVCIMHMKGEPRTMQADPTYADLIDEVRSFLTVRANRLVALGLNPSKVFIDPGIGFGKTVGHNLELIRRTAEFVATGFPVLIGVSRKSFVGKLLGTLETPLPPEERLEGTLAAQVIAQMGGAAMIRAHDVRASRRAMTMVQAVMGEPRAAEFR